MTRAKTSAERLAKAIADYQKLQKGLAAKGITMTVHEGQSRPEDFTAAPEKGL